jgi:tetratricopeptide (TPR) repeat protein
MNLRLLFSCLIAFAACAQAQINTDRTLAIGRNALYFEDFVLSIRYFNQTIQAKPYLAEPYFYRAVAKLSLDDFLGAEDDCSRCLDRNPFFAQAYLTRALARHSLQNLTDAISDYAQALDFRPGDRRIQLNLNLAQAAQALLLTDTARALDLYAQAIDLDPNAPHPRAARALIHFHLTRFHDALTDLNHAIRLDPNQPAFFINRALIRYRLNDLRGAMDDYDHVILNDPSNPIARFNRGLLRAQVADNNRAIEDFDQAILQQHDNFPAIFNRALLRLQTGDFLGAIHDLDRVLERYPDFLPAYDARAEAKQLAGDPIAADKDRWAAAHTTHTHTHPDSSATAHAHALDKFNQLLTLDNHNQLPSKYDSQIRGRIQDRNVSLQPEPHFILTYYEKPEPLKKSLYFDLSLDRFNARNVLPMKLLLTNREAPLNQQQIDDHFASINRLSALIQHHPSNPDYFFARALDYTLVQDFDEAIANYDQAIALRPDFPEALFNRAAVRYKQFDFRQAHADSQPELLAAYDYDRILAINPNSPFAFFNRANLRLAAHDYRAAIDDYSNAIQLQPLLAEAFFNRGLAHLAQNNPAQATADLSRAGELGLVDAYSLISRIREIYF